MIFENEIFYAEFESSEVPWIKLFAKRKCTEISDLEDFEQEAIFKASLLCERALREFFTSLIRLTGRALQTMCHRCIFISKLDLRMIATFHRVCGAKSKGKEQSVICD